MARPSSGVPMTPFRDFCARVEDLSGSDLAYNLRKWEPSHEINLALNKLYNANAYLRSQYGSSGPLKPWNSPRSLSPSHRHSHLHGRRPSSPNTPPHTPRTSHSTTTPNTHDHDHQLTTLTTKLTNATTHITSLESQLTASHTSLATAHATIHAHEATLTSHNTTLKSLHARLAHAYTQLHAHAAAAEQYAALEALQQAETARRRSWHDGAGAKEAEARELEAALERGRVLVRGGQAEEAENVGRRVLRRRKELWRDEGVREKGTREAQRWLCEILVGSGVVGKVREAEGMYLLGADAGGERGEGVQGLGQEEREWVLSNMLGLAHVWALQGSWRAAVGELGDLWRLRSYASRGLREEMVQMALKIVVLCEAQGQTGYAAKAFEVVYPDRAVALDGEALATVARLGVGLFNTGNDDGKAKAYLKQAWGGRGLLDSKAVRTIGWALAMLRAGEGRWEEVRAVLMEMPARATGSRTSSRGSSRSLGKEKGGNKGQEQDTDPSDDAILALLAHAQLQLGDYKGAVQNARALYMKHGIKSVSGNGGRPFRWCHVDTLMKALASAQRREDEEAVASKGMGGAGRGEKADKATSGINGGNGSSKFFEAREVWKQVYEEATREVMVLDGRALGETKKRAIKRHVEAGLVFVQEWKASCAIRGKVARSAEVVKGEAEGLWMKVAGGGR